MFVVGAQDETYFLRVIFPIRILVENAPREKRCELRVICNTLHTFSNPNKARTQKNLIDGDFDVPITQYRFDKSGGHCTTFRLGGVKDQNA